MSKNKSGLGLNLLIARSHQVATQIVGVQLSIANLLAIAVSAASIVAGTVTLTIERYPGSWVLWIVAGVIGAGLAILIEGMTLGALIRIRLASKKIKVIDEQVEAERDQIDWFALDKGTRRAKEGELRWKRARATRQFRKMRLWSVPIVIVGSLASAVAGGMFYHTVLAGLGAWESIGVAALFPFVVTCTFISSELFKDTQEEAIKEGYSGGGLADAALREETRRLSFQAVHDGIMFHFNDTEIQEELKMGTLGMLKDIITDLRSTIAPPVNAKMIVVESTPEAESEPVITDSIPAPIIDIQTGMRIDIPDTEESHLSPNELNTDQPFIDCPIGQECATVQCQPSDRNHVRSGDTRKRKRVEKIIRENPNISSTQLSIKAKVSRSYAGQIKSEIAKGEGA
jgi:hypothetical protein